MLVQQWFGWTGHQTPCGLVLWGPPGMGPARSPRGRREHGSRPLRLGSRRSSAAGEWWRRTPPWRAFPWWEKQARPRVGIPQAGPRRRSCRGRCYLEAGRARRPYPSRFKDTSQIIVVKGVRRLTIPAPAHVARSHSQPAATARVASVTGTPTAACRRHEIRTATRAA